MADEFIDLPGEIWKADVLYGVEGLEVSSLGRLRRHPRWVRVNQITDRLRLEPGRILSFQHDRKGYQYSSVSAGGAKTTHISVHRAVCAAFHGLPSDDKPHVRHIDGVSSNNREGNLCWGDYQSNSDDKLEHGTMLLGERHPMTRLRNVDAAAVRAMAIAGVPYSNIRAIFDVSDQTISNIKHRRTWQHLA